MVLKTHELPLFQVPAHREFQVLELLIVVEPDSWQNHLIVYAAPHRDGCKVVRVDRLSI